MHLCTCILLWEKGFFDIDLQESDKMQNPKSKCRTKHADNSVEMHFA